MDALAAPRLTGGWRTALRLGRVSNLPTVWTNVLAGMAVVGGPDRLDRFLLVAAAMSLLYVAGMYLNDAFDREIDARERPSRPIPAGIVGARTVFGVGFALLAAGVALLAFAGPAAGIDGALLGAAIVLYDWRHKGNPLSPAVMGLCRALVYGGAGLAVVASPTPALLAAGLAILLYVVGLTFIARQETLDRVENLWPAAFLAWPFLWLLPGAVADPWAALTLFAAAAWVVLTVLRLRARAPGAVPRAVVRLIAGIALLDAAIAASFGAPWLILPCALAFLATLAAQRWIAGT